MKRKLSLILGITLLLMLTFLTSAQDIAPTDVPSSEADIAISFPPPVWVLSDSVDILGTADVINLSNYFIEYREIRFPDPTATEATPDPETLWFPATLPGSRAVRNGVLGTWNTSTIRDGLYEIRLVINLVDGTQEIYRVSPLRVENDPQDSVAGLPPAPILQATPTNLPGGGGVRPTLAATPTNIGTGQPTVRALVDANIRTGDDTGYPRVASLFRNEQATVLGISSFGSGWFYVETVNGRRGFIAPSIVEFTGNIATLTLINPPPPPTPPATATPVTSANLLISGIELRPAAPQCGEAFDIFINITNSGTGASNASGSLTVIDRNNRTGITTASTVGGFPVINPAGNFVVVATLTVDTFFEETHTIVITLDSNGTIPETNEGDNTSSVTYTLAQASCG
ncbi:MAG: CARDB domain-containing protein [Phototrophicaceae bacterium]